MPRGKNLEYIGKPPEAVRAFQAQRTTARRRGIPFLLTFTEWWAWWQIDERWERRGNGLGKLMMARFNDQGPYSPGNVYSRSSGPPQNSSGGSPKASRYRL
jgi:hypothetical protein